MSFFESELEKGNFMIPECPKCNGETKNSHPAKFSPDDKYMKYRLAESYD